MKVSMLVDTTKEEGWGKDAFGQFARLLVHDLRPPLRTRYTAPHSGLCDQFDYELLPDLVPLLGGCMPLVERLSMPFERWPRSTLKWVQLMPFRVPTRPAL